MIINYKLYTESLNYKYPYERIIVSINGIVDYHKVFDFIENEFNIEINKTRSDETLINTNLIHIALNVTNLYKALNRVFRSIDDTEILRFYSTQFNDIDLMLKVIKDNLGSYYYNEKDILTLKDLKTIKQLLLYGRKNDFYQMYNRPKENIYESILNKLEGPSIDEIFKSINKKFMNGELSLPDYVNMCKDYGFEISDSVFDVLKKLNRIEKICQSTQVDYVPGFIDAIEDGIELNKKYSFDWKHKNSYSSAYVTPVILVIMLNAENIFDYIISNYSDKISDDVLEYTFTSNKPKFFEKILQAGIIEYNDLNIEIKSKIRKHHRKLKEFNKILNKYNTNESLLNKLEGPTEEEVIKNSHNLNSYKMLLLGIELQNYDIIEEALFKDFDTLFAFEWEILEHILRHKKINVLGYLIDNYNFNFDLSNTILYELNDENKEVYSDKFIKEVLDFLEKYEDKEEDNKQLSKIDKFKKFTRKLFHNESLLTKLEGPSDEEIRKFINHIKDINEKLSQAIKHNFFDMVEDIVRSNNYNEELALRNSLYFDNNKITYYLLKNNKILNSDNIDALNIVLRQASEFGNLELVIYSIKNGADINSGRSYALRYAIMGGYIDIAKYLIKHGADVELANSFIIKYKKFDDSKILLQLANANESLLNKLEGPNEEEFIKYLDSLGNTKKIKKIITLGEEYYKYLPDNLIVDSDLNLHSLRIKKLPDNLTIKGDLDCGVCNLSFLPRNLKVGGTLYCHHNFLTELPDDLEVGGSICCSNNELTSLPDNLTVNGWMDCGFNKLTKLPENLTVNGEFWCGKNALPLKIPASAKIKGKIHD